MGNEIIIFINKKPVKINSDIIPNILPSNLKEETTDITSLIYRLVTENLYKKEEINPEVEKFKKQYKSVFENVDTQETTEKEKICNKKLK